MNYLEAEDLATSRIILPANCQQVTPTHPLSPTGVSVLRELPSFRFPDFSGTTQNPSGVFSTDLISVGLVFVLGKYNRLAGNYGV